MRSAFTGTLVVGLMVLGILAVPAGAGQLATGVQAKVDAAVKVVEGWAADPVIVEAIKAHNASLPADQAAMTQEKWAALSVLDPFVRDLTRNPAATLLKTKRPEYVTEAFLSGTDGLKVAFLSKPTNWSHKGKPKHDVPMTGKGWQGPVEVDQSTGVQQLQVAVPVKDGGKIVGSLVVGLGIDKLK